MLRCLCAEQVARPQAHWRGESSFHASASCLPADSRASKLSHVLEENGASVCEPRRDGSIPIQRVTHIVSNTIDFPQYVESQAIMIPVVTTQWITASIARRRPVQVRPYSPDPRMIFSEVVVSCADLPTMDKESIIGATMALGGQETKDASRLTTHICALHMGDPKVAHAVKRGFKGKVVLPHWYVRPPCWQPFIVSDCVSRFDDCFKLGKRIDEGPYLLPDPEILKKSPEDELRIPVNTNLTGATSISPEWVPLPANSEGARPPVTVFQDRRLLLSKDLNISARLTKVIEEIVVHGGGSMVDDVDDCDMFICQYRDGPQYVKASRSCKEVGSLSWLFYLVVHNQWCNPLHRLLHYPIPRNGIEGFQGLRITVSNYGGEARIYLENLIRACGAEFTKTMKADNTHLITARDTSEKCKAAPEWGVAVVNHMWLEESYAKCEKKQINMAKFNHFPPRTNLGEIIGQTFFDESRLREIYYPGGEDAMSPRAKRKRKILEAAEDNAYHKGPAEGVAIGRPQEKGRNFDVMRDKMARDDPRAEAHTSFTAVETPIRSRPRTVGKENDSPSVLSTGGRSAKAKARDMLQCIAPDIALYEKEKRRHTKAGAPWGGKRAADLTEREQNVKPSRKVSPDNEHDECKRPTKKARPSLPEVEMRIVVTGFPRWVGDKNKEDSDRVRLNQSLRLSSRHSWRRLTLSSESYVTLAYRLSRRASLATFSPHPRWSAPSSSSAHWRVGPRR